MNPLVIESSNAVRVDTMTQMYQALSILVNYREAKSKEKMISGVKN
jgi:hypothetical protein